MLAAMCLASCDDNDDPVPPGYGTLSVGLRTIPGAPLADLTLYVFNSDGDAVARKSHASLQGFFPDLTHLPPGGYTVVLVAGVPGEGAPGGDTSLQGLAEWLAGNEAAFPGMMTAQGHAEVSAGGMTRLLLTLTGGSAGTELTTVRLALTVPGLDLPTYTTRADGKQLRCVVEAYRAGTNVKAYRRVQDCALQADGTFLAELSLMPGDYDLRLWADWNGGYYNADDLNKVLVLTDNYVANGETDKKDAYYGSLSLTVNSPSLTLPSGEGTQTGGQSSPLGEFEGALVRPFAKYRLIATDVEAYYNLIEKGEALPDIEDLQVRVTYEGFFPTGFNVVTGKPNDALNTGIHYTSVPTVAEGYDAKVNVLIKREQKKFTYSAEREKRGMKSNRQVGADFVLTNGEESFVTVTIQMVDTNTGEAVATVQHVKIPYKRGHLTTVTGHFLTAGKTPGGVQIDTEWGN